LFTPTPGGAKKINKGQFLIQINNMNIVVIGGTRGIGKEIVLNLSANTENKILVAGRNESSLRNLEVIHQNISTVTLDLSAFDSMRDIFLNSIRDNFEKVDILINVAGAIIAKDFEKISSDEARMLMETNFIGPASVIRTLKPLMSKGAHIVNISSMGGFQGSSKYPGLSYYSASKAALACLTECLAAEFKPSGIKINCLALGAVQTEMLAEAFPGYKAPLAANEMAEYISWFALNGQKYFNGKILPVALNNP
jgi:NAD(P)-dependent dehydrogenase (short-subunit alcohol dehydrogenase family)